MKFTVRRSNEKTPQLPAWVVNGEYEKKTKTKKTIYFFKTKQTLSAQKAVNIAKTGQTVKTINIRRKSKFFSRKIRLIF